MLKKRERSNLTSNPKRRKRHVDIVEYTKRAMIDGVKKEINKGVDLDERDRNYNCAAEEAAKRNDIEILKLLALAGADIATKKNPYNEPLLIAESNESKKMVNLIENFTEIRKVSFVFAQAFATKSSFLDSKGNPWPKEILIYLASTMSDNSSFSKLESLKLAKMYFRMPYPVNITRTLVKQFNLTAAQEEELFSILSLDGVRGLLANGFLKSNDLIQKVLSEKLENKSKKEENNYYKVLPIIAVKRILELHDEILIFNDCIIVNKEKKKLLDEKLFMPVKVMIWLIKDLKSYIYIPHYSMVGYQLAQDSKEYLKLKKLAYENISIMINYIKFRNALFNLEELPLEHLSKREQLASKLFDKLSRLSDFIEKSSLLLLEHLKVTKILIRNMNARHTRMEIVTKSYFVTLFNKSKRVINEFNFLDKLSGTQLGTQALIKYKYKDRVQKVVYHIKTHQNGKRDSSLELKPIDIKELFVYQLLEYMGYGPKVHFILDKNIKGNLFIASKDCGFTKTPNKKKKQFTLFKYNNSLDNFDESEIICLDILSRLLVLLDTTTNSYNFGKILVNGKKRKWQLIDFRTESRYCYILDDIYTGFLSGKGRYLYQDKLAKLLMEPNFDKKYKSASEFFNQLKNENRKGGTLLKSIDKVFCEMISYVLENKEQIDFDLKSSLGVFSEKMMSNESLLKKLDSLQLSNSEDRKKLGDFGRYIKGVKENFSNFEKGLRLTEKRVNTEEFVKHTHKKLS